MTEYVYNRLDRLHEISAGWVPGVKELAIYGHATDVDHGVVGDVDIWAGAGAGGALFTGFPAAAETLTLTSTSADDAAAGTGARTVYLEGVDSTWAEITETVTLTGLTGADTNAEFLRVNSARVITSGTGRTNAGAISITHTTTTANNFGPILVGNSLREVCGFSVPAGKQVIIDRLFLGTRNTGGGPATRQAALLGIRATFSEAGPWITSYQFWVPTDATPVTMPFEGAVALPEKCDFIGHVTDATADNLDITMGIGALQCTAR